MKLLKKALAAALVIVLVISLSAPALAAAKATASTMKLESKSGTVTITKSTGKTVAYSAGMSLYSGYTITTGSKSYANVSIDGSKVLKVDASSSVTIKKSGKKLKLYVNSGSAYFNVAKKLDSDESMSIQTSTMTTGIRGTIGVVSVASSAQASLMLLEGTASVVLNTSAGVRAVPVTAGQSLSVSALAGSLPTDPAPVTISADAIPGFVAVEIAADPALKARIEQAVGSVINVGAVAEQAQQKLEQEQAQQEKQLQELEQRLKEEVKKSVPQPTKPVEPSSPSTGGGGSYTSYDYLVTTADGAVSRYTAGQTFTVPAHATLKLLRNVGSSGLAKELLVQAPESTDTVEAAAKIDLNGFMFYGDITALDGAKLSIVDKTGGAGEIRGTVTVGTSADLSISGVQVYSENSTAIVVNGGTLTAPEYADVRSANGTALDVVDGTVTAAKSAFVSKTSKAINIKNSTLTLTRSDVISGDANDTGTGTALCIDGGSVAEIINTTVSADNGTALDIQGGTVTLDDAFIMNKATAVASTESIPQATVEPDGNHTANPNASPAVFIKNGATLVIKNENCITNEAAGYVIKDKHDYTNTPPTTGIKFDETYGCLELVVNKTPLGAWQDTLTLPSALGTMSEKLVDDKYCGQLYYNKNYVLKHGGTDTYGLWRESGSAFPDTLADGDTLTLLHDIDLASGVSGSVLTIPAPEAGTASGITLDLNGKTLKSGSGEAVVSVSSAAKLIVTDSSEAQTGTIENTYNTGNAGTSPAYAVQCETDGSFEINSGSLKTGGNSSNLYNSADINIKGAASLKYEATEALTLKVYAEPNGRRFDLDVLFADFNAVSDATACCVDLYTDCNMNRPFSIGDDKPFKLNGNGSTIIYAGTGTAFTLGSNDTIFVERHIQNVEIKTADGNTDSQTLLNVAQGTVFLGGASLTNNSAEKPTVIIASGKTLGSTGGTNTITNDSTTGRAAEREKGDNESVGSFCGVILRVARDSEEPATLQEIADNILNGLKSRLISGYAGSEKVSLVDGYWTIEIPYNG